MNTNGFRQVGRRKHGLLAKLSRELVNAGKRGVDWRVYLKHVLKTDLKELPNKYTTKEISGLISEIRQL